MGLDMYLRGHKFTPTCTDTHKRPIVDGYEVESIDLTLGYWRKHWALHTYIEDHYNPNDDRKVYFTADHLREIAEAVETDHLREIAEVIETDHLPEGDRQIAKTIEFQLQPEQIAKTIKTFKDAAAWMDRDDGFWRTVTYYGSW